MRVGEAEQLVCPFIAYQESSLHELYNIKCITTECMSWRETKSHEIEEEQILGMPENYVKKVINELKPLSKENCEGYCMRLRQ